MICNCCNKHRKIITHIIARETIQAICENCYSEMMTIKENYKKSWDERFELLIIKHRKEKLEKLLS